MHTTARKITALALIYTIFAITLGCGGHVPTLSSALPALKTVWPAACSVQYVPPYFACSFSKPTSFGGYYQGDFYQFLHTWRAALEVGLPRSPSGADATFEIPLPVRGGTTASIWGNVNFVAPTGYTEIDARVTTSGIFLFDLQVVSFAPGVCSITISRADGFTRTENFCSMTIGQMFFPASIAGPPVAITFTRTVISGAGTFGMKVYGEYDTPPPSFGTASQPAPLSTTLFPGCTFDPATGDGACTGTSTPKGGFGTCTWNVRQIGLHIEGDLFFSITQLTDPQANCPFPFPRAGYVTRFGRTVGYAAGATGRTSSSLDLYTCVGIPTDGGLCFNEGLGGMKIAFEPKFPVGCSVPDPGSCTIPLGNFDGTPIIYRTAIPAAGIDGGLNVDLPESLPNKVHVHIVVDLSSLAQ